MEGDGQFWITFTPQGAEAVAAAPLDNQRIAGRVHQMLGAVTGWRNKCPIRRSLQPTSSFDHFGSGALAGPKGLNPTILDFIQSLDLDWLGEPDAS